MRKMLILSTLVVTTGTVAGPTSIALAAKSPPNVQCMRLDRAEAKLRKAGFIPHESGGGLLGIIVKADWVVVRQDPPKGKSVTVVAGRTC